jgi:hypothetical protein
MTMTEEDLGLALPSGLLDDARTQLSQAVRILGYDDSVF